VKDDGAARLPGGGAERGRVATCAGNGWREMAASMAKDDGASCSPSRGVEHGWAATGFRHRRSGAGRVVAASDRRCRAGHGRSTPLWRGHVAALPWQGR
jgi:hypothetical protein